jgi:ADP-ribosylglycohydrolase
MRHFVDTHSHTIANGATGVLASATGRAAHADDCVATHHDEREHATTLLMQYSLSYRLGANSGIGAKFDPDYFVVVVDTNLRTHARSIPHQMNRNTSL